MTKYNGKYYLQYSGPGTQWKSYADGVYVSEISPTEGFVYQPYNPITYKPTGFTGGAGHGCMFNSADGRFWRAGTISISVNHWFERRINVFPAGFDKDDVLFSNTALGDYPMALPHVKETIDWMLLSYNKPVSSSSEIDSLPAKNAVDEEIRSYWAAKSADPGEWFCVDLGNKETINAIQVNFGEHNSKLSDRQDGIFQKYKLYVSNDGEKWKLKIGRAHV